MAGSQGPEGLWAEPHKPRVESSPCAPACYQMPLPEEIQVSPGDTEIHRVEPEDVANHLTAFHWELFRCVHEVGTVTSAGLGGWREKCAIVGVLETGRLCS